MNGEATIKDKRPQTTRRNNMQQVIQPKGLRDPRAGYSYSQGILVTGPEKTLFIAGQTAVDAGGNIVGKGDIEAQAAQVFENILLLLKEVGGSIENIVKTTTYITDEKYLAGLAKVRKRYYTATAPTSTLVVVKGLAHPDYLVEIEAVALL
jgi:enamine deaminase RidA (YjgF/YER057c/UK114 family)